MLPLNDIDALFGLFMVFIRCSSALMSSPLFGAQNTPIQVRILTSLSISFAISLVVKADIGHTPANMGALMLVVMNEVAAGLLIGMILQLVIQIAMIAGSFLDMQIGLGMSQTMNPLLGIPVTIIGQFKVMLATMIFLSMDGHHMVIRSIVQSYKVAPTLTISDMGLLQSGVVHLLGNFMMLSIQIAAPVLGVSIIIDAALGLMSKALPQLQPIQIGAPAKLALGMASVSLCLPALVAATQSGVAQSVDLIGRVFAR
jgi:flagellar biosynthesis protein FliR